jgi:uncharacterized membrane protein YgdD (TMEM256/DUF423 family)
MSSQPARTVRDERPQGDAVKNDKVPGLSVDQTRAIATTLMVMGVLFLAGTLTWDLNGGPSWLHAITWVGGAIFSYGLVTLVTSGRTLKR